MNRLLWVGLIATVKLYEPIIYRDRHINIIEIPAPKVGKIAQNEFEHVEFVIDTSFEHFIAAHSHL